MIYSVERCLLKGADALEITDANPELEAPEARVSQLIDADWTPPRRRIRPELIMVIIALLCAILLAVTIFLALPHMTATPGTAETQPHQTESVSVDEDPETALHQNHHAEAEPLPTIEPIIEPEANPYGRLDFQYDQNNYLYCLRQESYPGVDVSAFQKDIDWQKVKASGIRFAMLRLGYRGYESGKLVEDEYIQQNLKQTQEVDMPIGAWEKK